jgi:hypothetical protein
MNPVKAVAIVSRIAEPRSNPGSLHLLFSEINRSKEFLHAKGTELLLGAEIDPELFWDPNLGRVAGKIVDTGAFSRRTLLLLPL